MLTKGEVEAHERKLRRILAWQAGSLLAFPVLGLVLGDAEGESPLFLVAVLAYIVSTIRAYAYMLRDLTLRGKSPIWALFSFGVLLWLFWRRRYPIPTKDSPYAV